MSTMDFVDWIENKLLVTNMSRADLARSSGITTAQITRVLNREQGPGKVFLSGVARAFKIPIESVYRAAGLIPLASPNDEIIEEIKYIMEQLPSDERQDILEYIRLRLRLAEERGEHERRPRTRPAT